ncbi:MAG: hypothetical protein ACK5WP_03465 [Neisseriaceae bacterium]
MISQSDKSTGTGDGMFVHETKSIYFSGPISNYGFIHHEFIHADISFRHSKYPCLAEGRDKMLPFYPKTSENIKRYEIALDKGDNRIREFKQLWMKEVNREKLTQKETLKLEKYKDAAKNCFPIKGPQITPHDGYQKLLKLGWYPGKIDFTFLTNELIEHKVFDVKQTSSETIIEAESITPDYSVFRTLKNVEEKILRGLYSQSSKEMQLSERNAYTFQYLSAKSAEVFYPEATEIVENDRIECDSTEEKLNSKSEL